MRPTLAAHIHGFGNDETKDYISGIDVQMDGTWIGVNKSGKIAAL